MRTKPSRPKASHCSGVARPPRRGTGFHVKPLLNRWGWMSRMVRKPTVRSAVLDRPGVVAGEGGYGREQRRDVVGVREGGGDPSVRVDLDCGAALVVGGRERL